MDRCGCVYVGVDEYTRTIAKNIATARVEHICSECGVTIKKGESYERYKGYFDGSLFTNKTCKDCLSIREEFFCGGWLWGEVMSAMWEHISDMDGSISTECLLGLTKGAREKILDMIDRYWEEIDLEDGEE